MHFLKHRFDRFVCKCAGKKENCSTSDFDLIYTQDIIKNEYLI